MVKISPLPRPIIELAIYAGAATIALGVDITLLAWLVDGAGWHYLAAATASFVTGGVVLYFLSILFVFRFRRIADRRLELTLFVVLGLAGLAVNGLVMFIVVEAAHAHYLIAKLAAGAVTFFLNFLLRRQLLFVPP